MFKFNALLAICALLLAGCSVYNTGEIPEVIEHEVTHSDPNSIFLVVVLNPDSDEKAEQVCGRFKLPKLEPLPSIPEIPSSMRRDYQEISNRLLDHIIELQRHDGRIRYQIKEEYRKYLNGCQ